MRLWGIGADAQRSVATVLQALPSRLSVPARGTGPVSMSGRTMDAASEVVFVSTAES